MKLPTTLILATLLPACAMHIHVHEAPKPAAAVAQGDGAVRTASLEASVVRGVVLDTAGAGVQAHAAVVFSRGGSNSMGTGGNGRFALPTGGDHEFVVHASTEDGRVAIAGASQPNDELVLTVRPGAKFVIELDGLEKARCAVFVGGLRIADFGMRAGVPAIVVVPPGEQRVQIYEGNAVLQEGHFAAGAGQTESIRMKPRS